MLTKEQITCEYMLNYLAHIIQKPNQKTGVIVVIQGSQGTGKDTLGEFIGNKIIGIQGPINVTVHIYRVIKSSYSKNNGNHH